ncbi:unnamed protein product [Symbiodinium microadriaticum]|nr:unnamed protein product [Symbiodinium microadriaticum]
MAAKQVTAIRSKPSTSWKTLKCWETVLKDHCEFALFAEYKNLDEDAQKKLLQALEGAMFMQLASSLSQLELRNGKASRKNSRKSKAESSREDSALVAAVRVAADDPRVVDALTPDVFDILRDFLSSWGAPIGAEELLYRHNLHEVQNRHLFRQPNQVLSSDQSVTKRSCDSSWEHLRAVSIAGLQLFRSMTKMRLECKVVGSPHHKVGLTMVVEDSLGDRAHCGVYNLPGVHNQQTADQAIPLNSTLIIAEPFMKIMADGTRGIRVDNPEEPLSAR